LNIGLYMPENTANATLQQCTDAVAVDAEA
jgi:hypothetical protein